jgi:MFS family permease
MAFALGLVTVGAARPAASYKAIELGASALQVGVIGGAFGALALVAAIPIGGRVDRRGERGYLLAGLALLAISPLVQLGATGWVGLVAGQALLGLGQAGLAISMQALTANMNGAEHRDTGFARLAIAASAGQFLGPIVTGFAIGSASLGQRSAGIGRAYLLAAAASSVALVVGAVVVRSSDRLSEEPSRRMKPWTMVGRPGVKPALMASLAVLTTIDILVTYLPVLGDERGLDPSFVGLLLSVNSVAAMLSRFALPTMLRRLGRRRVLSFMLATSGLAMVTLAVTLPRWAILATVFCLGYGLGVGAPMTASWMATSAPPSDRATALAVRMTANRLGQILIPTLFGGIALGVGSFAVFLAGASSLFFSSMWVRRFDFRS